MFLKKAILVNWGNIPQLEFDYGPINLFSGGNGSGKTTAADAIQSLMTAAHENLFTYNPGQDETTQRGRGGKQVRTLASYILGCDDGSYARTETTDGYVAGVFYPTEGESGECFSAVMGVRAYLDTAGSIKQARQELLEFFIIPGEQLGLSDFVRRDGSGKYVVPLNTMATLLKKQFGVSQVENYDKKGPYLRRLYAALRGRPDSVPDREAKHAARTFANFMAYKPVKSINQFVANEILEPRHLGDAIKNVSELMKTIHEMEADTRSILDSIATLETGKQLSQNYIDTWIEHCQMQYQEASRLALVNQRAYLKAKNSQQQTANEHRINQENIQQSDQRLSTAHDDIIALEAQRQGVQALKDKDDLQQQIEHCNQLIVQQAKPLLEQDQQFAKNLVAAQTIQQLLNQHSLALELPQLDSPSFKQALKQVLAEAEGSNLDLHKWLAHDWVDIEPLEQHLEQIKAAERAQMAWVDYLHHGDAAASQPSLRDQLGSLVQRREDQHKQLKQRWQAAERDVQLLEKQKITYPPYVEAAVNAINQACPGADAKVLCDYVEVLDPRWQMAIEGYIGGARYSIIVNPEHEAEAISIVRAMRAQGRNRARVIQTDKARRDAERLHLPGNSIIHLMDFSHKSAQYFLTASYGLVQQVSDADELRHTARGITPEGLGSGNYAMFRCDIDDAELVFGQGARQRALLARQKELQAQLEQLSQAQEGNQQLQALFAQLEATRAVNCSGEIDVMLSAHRQLQQAQQALERLDLSDFNELEGELDALKVKRQSIVVAAKELEKDGGRLEERLRQIEKKVKSFADAQDAFNQLKDQQEEQLQDAAKLLPHCDYEALLQAADQNAEQAGEQEKFDEPLQQLHLSLNKIERELYSAVMAHNQQAKRFDNIVYDTGTGESHDHDFFAAITGIAEQLDQVHNRLKNNVLVDKHEKISALKDSFNTAFVTHLCHSIYQAINDGKRILDELNLELEHHRFGADKERFYFDYDWVPEFYEYWQFFKEVIATPNLGDGTSLFEADLSDSAIKVRDKMLTMLLDKDEQLAMRELNRISDYRHYRNYEIYKEPQGKSPIPLSQYGTGSGGQLETPAYIIRSAAVTAAFRFNEGDTHLRMVLVDEAFSKMDETRSREVIHYLTQSLGLQLMFIMPSSKSGPFMDLISNQFVFSKCPTSSPVGELHTRVLVDRKRCNQEKIKALWAQHRRTIRQQAALDFLEDVV